MYNVLLSQFMSGARRAGEPLNIGALSRELDVSQTPLREALARLEHTGLVQREALKGYRVSPDLSEREIAQLLGARLVLEPALTHEAGLRVNPEFLRELLATVEELDRAVDLADTETDQFQMYWTSDDHFHRLIAAQCGNPFLESAYLSLGGQMQRFRLFTKRGRTGVRYAAVEHREIYDALASRDADKARDLMRQHIERAKVRALAPRD
jgi:DNA-binding GntR family transcriptional regulator